MSDERNDELKRCPFCGSEATVSSGYGSGVYSVVCKPCGVVTRMYRNPETAIAAWNTRATPDLESLRGEIEGVKLLLKELYYEYIDRKAQFGDEYLWGKHEDPELIQKVKDAIESDGE